MVRCYRQTRPELIHRFAEEVARAPLYSPLGVWMQEHHAELQQMLRGKRPKWDEVIDRRSPRA